MTAEAFSKPLGFGGAKNRFLSRSAPSLARETEVVQEIPPLHIPDATVEAQSLQVFGRRIDAYHVTPDDATPNGRIFLANGWRGRVQGQRTFIAHLAEAGYSVTTFTNDFTRGDREKIREADSRLNTREFPKIAFVKAAAVRAVLDMFPVEQPEKPMGIVAHSEATIYAGIAANDLVDPDFFIQINAAGHARRKTLPSLFLNGIRESIQTLAAVDEKVLAEKVLPKEVVIYIRNNILLARQELRAIRHINTDKLVEHIHNLGLPTAYIGGNRDKIFPSRHMDRVIEQGIFDYVGNVKHGAHELCTAPREYAQEVLAAIDSFEASQSGLVETKGIVYQS